MAAACLTLVPSKSAGVLYTRLPEAPSRGEVLINAVWGLGPYAVDGVITPDTYRLDRDTLAVLGWDVAEKPRMFRDGVKTQSLTYLFQRLGELARSGMRFYLVVAGDGETRAALTALAEREVPGRHLFLGNVPREELWSVFGAGDVFAFPGIGESLGMVYLEAQAAGLPVVALADGGVAEVVEDGRTGFLTAPGDAAAYRRALATLLTDRERRLAMGEEAERHVRTNHDRSRNYASVVKALQQLAGEG